MAARQPSSRNPLATLPDDTLGIIASHLGVKDRVGFLSCCKATRRYQLSSPRSLFPDLAFDVRSTRSLGPLVVWLARVKQQVGKLSLSWDGRDDESFEMVALALLLGALADSSLHTLTITVAGRVRLGGWISMLQSLQSLSITANQLELGVGLSSLTALTKLRLTSQGMPTTIPHGALPPALKLLFLRRFDAASLGEALRAAGPLRHLKTLALCMPNGPWRSEAHWNAVAAHTQLTFLGLEGWKLGEVPHQLGALTALQTLSLSGALLGGNEALLEVFTSLTQLSRLHLAHTGLGLVPASVLALPALQDLDLRCNSFHGPVPITSSHRLTRLAIEASWAVEDCEGLTALTALSTLVLGAPSTEDRVKHGDAARLIHSLSKLPNFVELDAHHVRCNPNPFSVVKEVLLAVGALPFTILDQL